MRRDKDYVQLLAKNLNFAYWVVAWFFFAAFWIGLADRIWGPLDWLSKPDETDSATERSALKLYTDYGTGCQYIETRRGGLSPRLDTDGKQICRPAHPSSEEGA